MGDRMTEIKGEILGGPVDPNIIAAIPDADEVLSVTAVFSSKWAQSFQLDVRHTSGGEESYFMKISVGHHGREGLKGEFEATSAIYNITPDFCPKPIAWGTLQSEPDAHFYLCKFYTFHADTELEPDLFCEKLTRLHSAHTSPEGKFGFHCTTYNGDLPQDNTWSDSWEKFFDNGLRHVLKVREDRAGPNTELEALLPALFDKVIPRLLRPLESNGRTIQPSLVHGDLWCGNTGVTDADTGEGIIFDPSSFWAHHEYELGNWRPARNRLGDFIDVYRSLRNASAPSADFEDRNALYSLRFNLHAATLFPDQEQYLNEAMDEIRRLAEKYPDGYIEEAEPATVSQEEQAYRLKKQNEMAIEETRRRLEKYPATFVEEVEVGPKAQEEEGNRLEQQLPVGSN